MPNPPESPGGSERDVCPRCQEQKATSLQDFLDNRVQLGVTLCGDHLKGSPVAHLDCRDRTITRLSAELATAKAEVLRLRDIINIDRTGLAAGLNHVRSIVKGYWWIPEGEWGSYDYTERTVETLRREVGFMIEGVITGADRYLKQSGRRADAAIRGEPLEPIAADDAAGGKRA